MIQKIKEFFAEKNPSKKIRTIIVLGLVGLLIMIVSNIFTTKTHDPSALTVANNQEPNASSQTTFSKEKKGTTSDVEAAEDAYEKELTNMLNQMKGVSDAEVMVNLDSTNVKVYEKDVTTGKQTTDESDKSGGTREIQDNTKETHAVLIHQGDGEKPLLVQTRKADVRGVFVIAKGVDHPAVKKWVVDAVAHVLDVPTHKVSVMPKK